MLRQTYIDDAFLKNADTSANNKTPKNLIPDDEKQKELNAVFAMAMSKKRANKKLRWEKPIRNMLKVSKHTKKNMEKSTPKFFTIRHFWGPLTIPEKHVNLLRTVSDYFTVDVLRTHVIPFVTRSDDIPLRLIGWLVVNYVKEFPVVYMWKGEDGKQPERQVNVLQGYSECMKRYHRRHFDPFRRKHRIFFEVDNVVYETTIGQLLFLQWAFRDGVVQYARNHAKEIETHMINYNYAKLVEKETDKKNGVRHKRSEFVKSKRRKMTMVKYEIVENCSDNEEEKDD